MACPICNCERFYIKDPEDSYEIQEFECKNGSIRIESAENANSPLAMTQESEIFCHQCAWHGLLKQISK